MDWLVERSASGRDLGVPKTRVVLRSDKADCTGARNVVRSRFSVAFFERAILVSWTVPSKGAGGWADASVSRLL